MEAEFQFGEFVKTKGLLSDKPVAGWVAGIMDGDLFASNPHNMNLHLWYKEFGDWWKRPVYHIRLRKVDSVNGEPVPANAAATIVTVVEQDMEPSSEDAWLKELEKEISSDPSDDDFGDI